ncbi:hypothetical protein HaLaN_18406 [Haematococcus lacustris]|uniref:Secreted protein n=1 Tax=Haematococcus lacustris TaxID=44745 RepID=A0A699ZYP0_HAELA|nr:hypothetical protein HaLaN_18406 [Haematococcus lacustris]
MFRTASFSIAFITSVAADQCASSDHQRKFAIAFFARVLPHVPANKSQRRDGWFWDELECPANTRRDACRAWRASRRGD